MLISDLYDEPEEIIRALHHFRHRRHEVIVFHVLDKAEIDFPFRDVTAFHDLETDERIQVDPAYVRDEYAAGIKAFIEGYRRACAEAQIDYVLADTSMPYDFMLVAIRRQTGAPMSFAAPLFLLTALAAAIPIVLHLVNRRRAKDAPFPTLRFLKLSVQKTRRRKRIEDLLLMAVRAAVLLLLALGLARPVATNLGLIRGGGQTAVAIVLDNSASMGTIDQDRLRLETAAAAADANPRSARRRRSGGAAADLRTAVGERRQTRPHAAIRPPNPATVPRQLRAGQPRAEAAASTKTPGRFQRPEQADFRAYRHAAGVVGRRERERGEGRGEKGEPSIVGQVGQVRPVGRARSPAPCPPA